MKGLIFPIFSILCEVAKTSVSVSKRPKGVMGDRHYYKYTRRVLASALVVNSVRRTAIHLAQRVLYQNLYFSRWFILFLI